MATTANANNEFQVLKQNVQQKFTDVRAALSIREKLLLRQVDVIAQQMSGGCANATATTTSAATGEGIQSVKFLTDQEEELLAAIRSFGRFQLVNMNLALHDVYLRNEDYITPSNDHETMYKCLKQHQQQKQQQNTLRLKLNPSEADADAEADDDDEEGEGEEEEGSYDEAIITTRSEPEAIVVDFSKNKSIIEHNAKNMNESIINITLQEAKELIKKARIRRETPIPPLNLEELNDELESSIADAISSLGGGGNETSLSTSKKSKRSGIDNGMGSSPATTTTAPTTASAPSAKKHRFMPKITINNCNGTINLRNISTLTINCATEESVKAEIPIQHEQPSTSSHSQHHHGHQSQKQPPPNRTDRSDEGDGHAISTKSSNNSKKSKTLMKVKNLMTGGNQPPTTIMIETSTTDANSTPTSSATSTPTPTASSSNISSTSSSRSQSKKWKSGLPKFLTTQNTGCNNNNENPTPEYNYDGNDVIIGDGGDDLDADDNNAATCDFYNRLLNEIKNSIKEKTMRTIDNTHYLRQSSGSGAANIAAAATESSSSDLWAGSSQSHQQIGNSNITSSEASKDNANSGHNTSDIVDAPTSVTSSSRHSDHHYEPPPGRHLVLKNFENLKIILEANSDEETFHPVQIEQWLAEIISETDLEPMQNTEILEHSKIFNESE